MIRRVVNIDEYWEVIVYYDIDYNFFNVIAKDLVANQTPVEEIEKLWSDLRRFAKAFTQSNTKQHRSIVGFNKHNDYWDYVNSVIHEAEHIKQAMLYSYDVEDEGEYPAYTIAYIAVQLLKFL